MLCEVAHVTGENDFSLGVQRGGDVFPAGEHRLSGFDERGSRRVSDGTRLGQLGCDAVSVKELTGLTSWPSDVSDHFERIPVQDVDAVVARECGGDERPRRANLCQVARDRMRVTELCRELVESFDPTRGEDDSRTDRVEHAREAGAETRARTGDDRDLAVQMKRGQGVEHTRNLAAEK